MKVFLFLGLMVMALVGEETKAKPPIIERAEITVGKMTYKRAQLVLVTPTEVLIKHDTGRSRVPASLLDPELLIQLGCDKAEVIAAPSQKTPANQVFRYRVTENREEGIVGAIWIQREEHFSIPGGQSSSGGGGGVSGKTLKWADSGKEVWIPHTAATESLENETFFTAKVTIPGKTKRIWDDQVAPQHDLIEIIPEPVEKR